jgi:hypothetical protein
VAVFTAVTSRFVAALDQRGTVYVCDDDEAVSKLALPEKVKKISSSGENIVCISTGNSIFVWENGLITSYYAPIGFDVIEAVYTAEGLVALSSEGEVACSRVGRNDLTTSPVPWLLVPEGRPISFVGLYNGNVLFVRGRPSDPIVLPSPIPVGVEVPHDTFICANSLTVYFVKSNRCFSELSSAVSFITGAGRAIEFCDDSRALLSLNFVRGDRITIEKKMFEVVGFADGAPWVRSSSLHCLLALPDLRVAELSNRITGLQREGHDVVKLRLAQRDIWVDVTPLFCRTFGYEPGDLVWVEGRGIVEFYGVFGLQLVFLDLATRFLFLHENVPFSVLKRISRTLPHTRSLVTQDGALLELDICAGPLFAPTDRVMSPIGEATVLGFAGVVYIQTDEMRMEGVDGAASDVFQLKLIRRINAKAERTVFIGGEPAVVSLNTEDSISGLLPGDAAVIERRYAKVIGFRGPDIVVKFEDEKECDVSARGIEVIYRSDIAAKRVSAKLPPVEVGSPMIPETNVLPGDIVENADIGECEFYGCQEAGTIFISKTSDDVFSLTFGILLLPGYFTVKQRPAFDRPLRD